MDAASRNVLAWLRAHSWDLLGYALAMLYGLPSAWYPFGSDQAIHWYLGHGILLGQVPYTSGISGKPPLIFAVHAFAELLFGNRQSSIRVLEILAMPGFGWLLARTLRGGAHAGAEPTRDGEAGAAALLLSAANYTYQDYWNTAHPEFWMTLALITAAAFALREGRAWRRALLVGALCMIAFLLKYPAAAVALPIAAYSGIRALAEAHGGIPARLLALVREASLFLLGAGAVLSLTVLPFALTGTLREMIEVCIDMTENYAGAVDFPRHWYRPMLDLREQGGLYLGALALLVLGTVRVLLKRRPRELAHAGFGLALALASIASVVLQKRLFAYHWLASYPFIVWLAAWGLRQLLPRNGWPTLLAAVGLSALAFTSEPLFQTKQPPTYAQHVGDWWAVMRGKTDRRSLTMAYHRVTQADRFSHLVLASELIRERARPGDALCLTCFISPVYQLTGLRCNTRHAIGTFVPLGPRSWQAEYQRDLRERPPRFMVSIHTYPLVNRRLRRSGYRQIARFGTVIVYERAPVLEQSSHVSRESRVVP